jgi:hypothetical protein
MIPLKMSIELKFAFLFSCFLFILSITSCNTAEPATYFLPENFEGMFTVIYSQKFGKSKEYENDRRIYRIPSSGILMTQFDFQDGNRNDLFLIKSSRGYDTLQEFLPAEPFKGTNIRTPRSLTHDTSEIAINFRQVITYYPKFFNSDQKHHLDSSFAYELITIGKASTLKDDSLKKFSDRVDKFLQDSLGNGGVKNTY